MMSTAEFNQSVVINGNLSISESVDALAVRYTCSADQSINNATDTVIIWDTTDYIRGGFTVGGGGGSLYLALADT